MGEHNYNILVLQQIIMRENYIYFINFAYVSGIIHYRKIVLAMHHNYCNRASACLASI